jgi:hypothetical protein
MARASEQVGMSSGTGEIDTSVIKTVNEEPIPLYMALGKPIIRPMQRMFTVLFRQGFSRQSYPALPA